MLVVCIISEQKRIFLPQPFANFKISETAIRYVIFFWQLRNERNELWLKLP